MNKSLLFVITASTSLVLISCKGDKPKLDSEEDKTLYALGAKFGSSLTTLNLSEKEIKLVAQGFRDSALGIKTDGIILDEPQRAEKIQALLDSKRNVTKVENQKNSKDFIEKFVAGGGKKTDSGLAYQIVKEGEGENPGPNDVVEIHYKASLPDGKVFMNTKDSGQPSRYPLDKIIPGWAQGVQLIKPGGQVKLVIPPELAYGDNGAPPNVPGGSAVVMEVELLSVIQMKKQHSEAVHPTKASLSAKGKKAGPDKEIK